MRLERLRLRQLAVGDRLSLSLPSRRSALRCTNAVRPASAPRAAVPVPANVVAEASVQAELAGSARQMAWCGAGAAAPCQNLQGQAAPCASTLSRRPGREPAPTGHTAVRNP